MKIKLTEFRVQNFRCLDDSGWIDINDITALVGINESGKTAILQALRSLNPGNDIVDIDKIRDFPRVRLTRDYSPDKIVAQGKFLIPNEYVIEKKLHQKFNIPQDKDLFLILTRLYNQNLLIDFEDISFEKKYIQEIFDKLQNLRGEINRKQIESPKIEVSEQQENQNKEVENQKETPSQFTETVKKTIIVILDQFRKSLNEEYNKDSIFENETNRNQLKGLIDVYNNELSKYFNTAKEELKPFLDYLETTISELSEKCNKTKLYDEIKPDLPVFIYFEDYQILKGSIDISKLIKALKEDLNYAEIKIQDILFKHVKLDPFEIYKLGPRYLTKEQESQLQQRINQKNISANQITTEFYAKVNVEKERQLQERKILLDSASQAMTETLNKSFQEKEYLVEYTTDGQYLQILVSDDVKRSKINLEDRSKGFRWYFSFFLVFLVESEGLHKNAILLLDEPGIHLHLKAQFNLINFFQKLKETNQIIYTTHSPFLIDENHLEQVRSVFQDKDGITIITDNNLIPDEKSIFPLQAALSYKTSQVIYKGLKQLLVEGDSDYNYIKAINKILFKLGKETLDKDIIIVPCKSASKIDMYARLFIDLENVPVVLLDSDKEGKIVHNNLISSTLFKEHKKNVMLISDYIKEKYELEIEDLIGKELIVETINRNNLTNSPISAEDIKDGSLIDNIVAYCKREKIEFKDRIDWKYQLSVKFKNDIFEMNIEEINNKINQDKINIYEKLVKNINKLALKKNID